jgi:hypothetical protein
MRLGGPNARQEDRDFAKWLLDVGHGWNIDPAQNITLPETMKLPENSVPSLIDTFLAFQPYLPIMIGINISWSAPFSLPGMMMWMTSIKICWINSLESKQSFTVQTQWSRSKELTVTLNIRLNISTLFVPLDCLYQSWL